MVIGIGNGVVAAQIRPRALEKSDNPAQTPHLAANQAALEKLRQPRQRSEAENKLEDVLQAMKSASKSSKLEAARRKLEQIKARVKALEMAAASAAARGDAKAAKALAREVKQLARDMAGALREAGQGGGAGGQVGQVAPMVQADAAVQQQNDKAVAAAVGGSLGEGRAVDATARAAAAIKGADIGNPEAATDAAQDKALKQQLEAIKTEARDVLKQLKKLLTQARAALLHPNADKDEQRKADKAFTEAEQALADLTAASLPSEAGSGGIDLQA